MSHEFQVSKTRDVASDKLATFFRIEVIMHKINFVISWIMVITLTFSIMAISSVIALTMPATYKYSFNDSQAVTRSGLNLTDDKVAMETVGYLVNPTEDSFQIYEDNGKYQDPIFENDELSVARKMRKIYWLYGISGLISLIIFGFTYRYLYKNNFKDALRNRFWCALGLVGTLDIARIISLSLSKTRGMIYSTLVGIELPKKGLFHAFYGSDFAKAYLIFSTVFLMVLFGIIFLFNYKRTRPNRIFFR